MNQEEDDSIAILVANGLDRDSAIAALAVFGSAQAVLLHNLQDEDFPLPERETREAELGERYLGVVEAARNLDWRGVDLRQEQSIELSQSIVQLGADFLRQAVSTKEEQKKLRPESVQSIVEMGFSNQQATEALRNSNGNLEQAIAVLLDSEAT